MQTIRIHSTEVNPLGKNGRSKVLEETVETIKALSEDPAWRSRGYLPGLRDMARMAGCSHYTMWKAVKILEGKGLLEVRPGRRIRIPKTEEEEAESGNQAEMDPSQAGVQYKWERLRRQIEMDILSGTFRPGETLPTLKELGARYGASFLTLKKALRALEGGVILHGGPGAYSVASLRPPPRSVLAYLAWGDETGQLKFGTPFDHEILGALGNECARTGIRLEKIIYIPSGDRLMFYHGRKAQATLPDSVRECFGFLVRTVAPRDVVPDLVPRLAALGKPVAVLDEMGSVHFPKLQSRYPNLAVFRHTISGTPARQMGAYLAGQGHREVAYISPFHGTSWSMNRFVSLQECFRSLGPGYRVTPYTIDIDYQLPFEEEDGGAVEVLAQAMEKTKGWKPEFPPVEGIIEKIRPYMRSVVWREWVLKQIAPVLETALRRKEITAWVACDDDTALIAYEFLQRKGLRPPRDLSLVGFDDTSEGARLDLTSYNFDFTRFFHGVVIRLLDPPALSLARSRHPIEIEGRIVERGSSGPPPARAAVPAAPAAPGHAPAPALQGNIEDTLPRMRRRKRV
jgi:DNA-binding transcriptional regulator YhcF (GntR family)